MCHVVSVITMVLAMTASVAPAQVSETDQLQQIRADIAADRQALVAANLGLTEAEGQAFWPLYRQYRGEMAKVMDRLQTLIQDYAKVYENPTGVQAKAMVDEMLAIQKDELKVRTAYVPKFRKVLPEIKVGRFLQIENKVDAIIKLELADGVPLIGTPG
jgi:hypothetical protein